MKRTIPLLITALGGFTLIVAFFVPQWQASGEIITVWFDVLASIAFLLGGGNLLKVHLQKISDRKPGWGYSAVTLLAFSVTLWIGMAKVGVRPGENSEDYGRSFVSLPLSALPVVSVAGELPESRQTDALPASVRSQFAASDGTLRFRGWMDATQRHDLIEWEPSLAWRAAIEELHTASQVPDTFNDRLSYDVAHEQLGWEGSMSESEHVSLQQLFPDQSAALSELHARATRVTTVAAPGLPAGLQAPAGSAVTVSQSPPSLTVSGPLTPADRDRLLDQWGALPRVRPLSTAQQAELMAELQEHGPPLTDSEQAAVHAAIHAVWRAPQLVAAMNSAGVSPAVPKSWRELRAEQQAGVHPLTTEKSPSTRTELAADQIAAIERFAADPAQSREVLQSELQSGATALTPAQLAAANEFLDSQPTVADFRRQLALRLAKLSEVEDRPLARVRIDRLLQDTRNQAAFAEAVHQLYRDSHVTRFAWAGDYKAEGSPFWWIYEYLFQPLTATMFALLAFYVSSAAFRSFRAKNTEAVLLLGTAFLMLIAQTALGAWLTAWVPDSLSALRADEVKRYIMSLFATAGNRAIMIGIALGIAATSLQVLLGVDRSYLGRGDD